MERRVRRPLICVDMSIPDSHDPIALFAEWYADAMKSGQKNPTAVTPEPWLTVSMQET